MQPTLEDEPFGGKPKPREFYIPSERKQNLINEIYNDNNSGIFGFFTGMSKTKTKLNVDAP